MICNELVCTAAVVTWPAVANREELVVANREPPFGSAYSWFRGRRWLLARRWS